MPRKPRVEYPEVIYHMMSRANGKGNIFETDVDRLDFVKSLAETCTKTGFQAHDYCLMRNHFHLVVEIPNGNLVAGMKWFLSAYTVRFNHRNKRFRLMFSGRYKALITSEQLKHRSWMRRIWLSAQKAIWKSWRWQRVYEGKRTIPLIAKRLIPSCFQDETNSLVFQMSGVVARGLQIHCGICSPLSPSQTSELRRDLISC